MIRTLIAIAILFAAGCSNSAGLKKSDLYGTWKGQIKDTDTGQVLDTVMTYKSDGTFSQTADLNTMGVLTPQKVTIKGTWVLKGDKIIATATNASTSGSWLYPSGEIPNAAEKARETGDDKMTTIILSLSPEILVFKDDDGEVYTFKR